MLSRPSHFFFGRVCGVGEGQFTLIRLVWLATISVQVVTISVIGATLFLTIFTSALCVQFGSATCRIGARRWGAGRSGVPSRVLSSGGACWGARWPKEGSG